VLLLDWLEELTVEPVPTDELGADDVLLVAVPVGFAEEFDDCVPCDPDWEPWDDDVAVPEDDGGDDGVPLDAAGERERITSSEKKTPDEKKQTQDVRAAEHMLFNTPFTELKSSTPHTEAAHDLVASANVGWLHKHAVSDLREVGTKKINHKFKIKVSNEDLQLTPSSNSSRRCT
jgi:hypothetical protein